MTVREAIEARRAYRSLDPVAITPELIEDLGRAASLAPSCFNNQPTRFVFAYDPAVLVRLHGALSKGNEWIRAASMIVAAFGEKAADCQIRGREYYLFDIGLATAFLILRATELGLVAHPVAGFHEDEVKAILGIPTAATAITLVNVGRHSSTISPVLSEKQVADEQRRPPRRPLSETVFHNRYPGTSWPTSLLP